MIKLKENKGVLLITTFVVAMVISVMSAAYISGSLVLNQSVQREKAGLQSFYTAEKGIEYAYIESQNNNWNWRTHQVAATDLDGDGKINDLIPAGTAPTVTLNTTRGGKQSYVAIAPAADPTCPSCYRIYSANGTLQTELKTYADPQTPDQTLVLARNAAGSVSRIIKYRITRRSMYRYYYYYPKDTAFGGMFDGKGAGGIYVNGNIGLGNAAFNNITELSTNANGSIYLTYGQYAAPYSVDNRIGGIDGKGPLYTLINGIYIYSLTNLYPWGTGWPPGDWRNVNSHFSGSAGSVNTVALPRTLSTSWQWSKYSGAGIPGSERPVQFYDANGKLASDDYWKSLQTQYGENYFDPSFWSNKTYQRTPAAVSVKYLNTAQQANDWNAWLNSTGINLKSVVREKSSGGYDTVAPNIQASYSDLAKTAGLYVGQDSLGKTQVYLNGKNLGSSLPAWIADNVQFFNTVRPKVDSNGVPVKENVLQLDISAIPSGQVINNGIIYIASKNLRVVNASKLPASLTIVSPYNVYIKGGYNTDTAWQPSAVITNSLLYFLSDNFNDPTKNLPANIYPREYPSELQWIDLSKFTPGKTENMQALETEIKRFFGLSPTFDISSSKNQPADLSQLQSRIRSQYTSDYQSLMPDKASSTTFNLAVASPYPYNISGYQLERWTGSAIPAMKGAFLQLPSTWAKDDYGNPISPDVPANYIGRRPDYNGKIIARPNNSGQDPATDPNNSAILARNPSSEYEDKFISQRPPGDFFVASQALWEETSDFNHNI